MIPFLFLLISTLVRAESCPEGPALSATGSFKIQFGNFVTGQGFRTCDVNDVQMAGLPLEVIGCFPFHESAKYLQVRAPQGWSHPCFQAAPDNFIVHRSDFMLPPSQPTSRTEIPCPEALPQSPLSAHYYSGRGNPIALLIQDFQASENNQKTPQEIEKYHRCLLGSQREQARRDAYSQSFRFQIEEASVTFGVPLGLLTCLCGRESRFQANAQSETGAKGLCQATDANLIDVEKWRREIPAIREAYNSYVQKLGNRLEDRSCANAPLSKSLLVRCPSLAFAAASIYLSYGYSRIEGNTRFRDLHWTGQGLGTLVTVAAAYNVGVPFTDRALRSASQNRRENALLLSTCERWGRSEDAGRSKFRELRGHMLSLRACLKQDVWLDHQGRPLGGECTPSALSLANSRASMERFSRTIPESCPSRTSQR
jgi:hypothetical protein